MFYTRARTCNSLHAIKNPSMRPTHFNWSFILIILLSAMTTPAWANTIVVNSTADSGLGSLRDAVVAATSGDTIRFDASLNMDTIKLTTGEITLNKNILIIGNGETNTIIDGQANSRIFYIPAGATVAILGVTLQNGNGRGAISSGNGGAVLNGGQTTFTNTTISGNIANSGGGVLNSGLNAKATFANTTISGNTSNLSGGGVSDSFGETTFTNTTISGNTTNPSGSGVSGFFSEATFTNTIVAKNGPGFRSNINLSGSTITDGGNNLIGNGTGQTAISDGMNGNIVGTTAVPIDPLFIMDVPTGVGATIGGDLRLQDASPAIDAGNNAALPMDIFDVDGDMDVQETHPIDQQGLARTINMTVDIGAYEHQGFIVSPSIPTLGQWGLIILALSILTVSLLSLKGSRVAVIRDLP